MSQRRMLETLEQHLALILSATNQSRCFNAIHHHELVVPVVPSGATEAGVQTCGVAGCLREVLSEARTWAQYNAQRVLSVLSFSRSKSYFL